jgi:hypothetical protein
VLPITAGGAVISDDPGVQIHIARKIFQALIALGGIINNTERIILSGKTRRMRNDLCRSGLPSANAKKKEG